MAAYTGETQRLEPPNDLTLLSDLLTTDSQIAIQASHKITYQIWALDAARRYLESARRLLEEYHRYQAVAAQHPALQLPPEIAAIVQEVQR